MKTYQEWLNLQEGESSSRVRAVDEIVDALKSIFLKYDVATRKHVWKRLTSDAGKELVEKIIRNPHTYLSKSNFTKLVQN